MKFVYQNNTYDLILMTLSGSRFYGTYYDAEDPTRIHPFDPTRNSDHDWRGIFIAHPDTKLGMTGNITEIEIKKGKDGKVPPEQQELIKEINTLLNMNMPMDVDFTLYEIKKFITLALDANPNLMDIIFTDDEAVVYENEKGKKLRAEGKDIFMSSKTKFTFSGYGLSQLKRVKGHKKYIVKYPKTHIVLRDLEDAFKRGYIDYHFITDHFGGKVSEYVTGIKQQDANKLENLVSIEWDQFVDMYSSLFESDNILTKEEWNLYRKPQLIDYCKPKDIKGKKLALNSIMDIEGYNMTIKEFLLTKASFRSISNALYNIFTPPNEKYNGGIFTNNGNIKTHDPEEVGDFCFVLGIDRESYKNDLDEIDKLWIWKTGRNEKRSVLEENFGYDVKHCSHLFRLLIGAKNILTTGEYHPRLTGENLKLVKSILNGQKEYDWIVSEAEKMEKELDVLYKQSKLPKTPNHKRANELLLELSRNF